MNSTTFSSQLYAIVVAVCLSLALPAFGAPAKPHASKAASSPAASATPEAKARPFPFRSTVISVDKGTRTFRMGKKNVHQVHVMPETKVLKGDETPATFEEIVEGIEVRGAVNKRADGDYEAVTIKIGPKAEASPAAPSPSPSKSPAKSKKP